MVKKILIAASALALSSMCFADVRLDVKNASSEDCSVALHARADKTRWITQGWYVFVDDEEAPIILEGVSDIHNVYLYHDCNMQIPEGAETKKAYVKINREFNDDIPKDDDRDYQEETFIRLNTPTYTIENTQNH